MVFLANSEFAVISVHASKKNCRNPSIFRFSNAATKLKPRHSKANVLVRRTEALLNRIRLPDAHQVQSFMPLLAFDRVRDNAAAIDMT